LERRLASEGYLIVQPERLSFSDQIMIFNGLRRVVGPFGSALHTVLFHDLVTRPRTAVLCEHKVNERFVMVDVVKRSRALYINCMSDVTEGANPRLREQNERHWSIDVEAAMASLEQEGFLARRGRR
jgi:capsular polysaccharide biosynthesis protein